MFKHGGKMENLKNKSYESSQGMQVNMIFPIGKFYDIDSFCNKCFF